MGRNPIMMLEMMATMMSNKEATDRAIKDLLEYQASGYSEEKQPFGAVITMIIKWQQGDRPIEEVLKNALKHGKIIDNISKTVNKKDLQDENYDEWNNKDGDDDGDEEEIEGSHFTEMNDENGNKIKVRVVPMGKAGEA